MGVKGLTSHVLVTNKSQALNVCCWRALELKKLLPGLQLQKNNGYEEFSSF